MDDLKTELMRENLRLIERLAAAERVVEAALKLPDYEWSVGHAQRLDPVVKAAFGYAKAYKAKQEGE